MKNELEECIKQLNSVCLKALGAASAFCISNTNKEVEPEHFLFKLLDMSETELVRIIQQLNTDSEMLRYEFKHYIHKLDVGESETPVFSKQIYELLMESKSLLSQYPDEQKIRSGTLFWAYLNQLSLSNKIDYFPLIKRIYTQFNKNDIKRIIVSTIENDSFESHSNQKVSEKQTNQSSQPYIDKYTIDLVARAKSGLVDPVYGRDAEIRQMINILIRRRQNNPVLTGEAGVGKTAVVEGLAVKILKKEVPQSLKNARLFLVDLAMLLAGASIRGEFEKRLKSLIIEVKNSASPVILFIDEVHSLMGAGGNSGTGDAANILKPALAREEFRLIGATTNDEFHQYIEKDPAFTRRFQRVRIEEPDEKTTEIILNNLVKKLEQHHGVMILNEAITDAVKLSKRYITERRLPDKAINILDTACSQVSISQRFRPYQIEDICTQVKQNEVKLNLLRREHTNDHNYQKQLKSLYKKQIELNQRKHNLETQLNEEKKLVNEMLELQKQMNDDNLIQSKNEINPTASEKYFQLGKQLKKIQNNNALISPNVGSTSIASVISDLTDIPLGQMLVNEIDMVLNLTTHLKKRVIGQDNALDMISRKIKPHKANINDPEKPAGIFLLTGPSGVGKTETAERLARLLFGKKNIITINMSEYQESYTISALKGSPPGYVGHGKGGILTEEVRRKPYSLILLDEFEKAHSDVKDLFYQVFDKGVIEDSEANKVDFKNTLIFLTSNVASALITNEYQNAGENIDYHSLIATIKPRLLEVFEPAFLGRLTIVPYLPLSRENIREIIILKMQDLKKRFKRNHQLSLTYNESVIDFIADKCTETDIGARYADHIIEQKILPDLSEIILCDMASGKSLSATSIQVNHKDELICVTT